MCNNPNLDLVKNHDAYKNFVKFYLNGNENMTNGMMDRMMHGGNDGISQPKSSIARPFSKRGYNKAQSGENLSWMVGHKPQKTRLTTRSFLV